MCKKEKSSSPHRHVDIWPLPSTWWLLPGGVQPLWAGCEATGFWEALWATAWPLQQALLYAIKLLSWPTPTWDTPLPTLQPLWGSRQQAPGGWTPTSPTTSFSTPETFQTTAWGTQVRRSEVQFNLILHIHCLFQCHLVYIPVFSMWIKYPMEPLHHLHICPPHQKKHLHQPRNQSRRVWIHTLTCTDQKHTAEPTRKSLVRLWCNP